MARTQERDKHSKVKKKKAKTLETNSKSSVRRQEEGFKTWWMNATSRNASTRYTRINDQERRN